MSVLPGIRPMPTRYFGVPILLALCALLAPAALATTYYVGPSGGNSLSTNSSSPGSLTYAAANAASGSTVILENGTYNTSSTNGVTVNNSSITFQAQTWHGATVENTTGSGLLSPGSSNPTGDIWQGVVFGPATGLGWSGGGGASWEFLDCVFTQNGGIGSGNSSLFERCVFTDGYSNEFDINGATGVTFQDCIARRSNRASADDDAVGNKDDGSQNLTYNDFIAYDNNGPALWFDTDNDGWVIENSTFFGNHGGNNWYYGTVGSGSSTTQFTVYGQDGQGISVGQPIMGLSGANQGYTSVIQTVSGYNPSTITVSPALHATPAANDQFAIQQDAASPGDGFITEANDDGIFENNVLYSNTDAGYWDHSSGGTTYGGSGGLTIEDNLFAYCGEGFFVWSDARDQGPATVEHNQFKFLPGTTSAFDSWGSTPGTYPYLGSITFDYNDYNPDNGNGDWAVWYTSSPPPTAGGLTSGSQPSGQDYLQNPSTWNQDYHSNTNSVAFLGTYPSVYIWPAASDTSWTDDYFPNNTFGLSNSIHQINDTNGAISDTIDAAISGKGVNSVVTIPVSAHTPITGSGPYSCEVYDLNGRWVTLSIPTANLAGFESAVPPYVTCGASNATVTYNIQVTLNSIPPYGVTATYNPSGGSGGLLSGSSASASSSYNLTTLGTSDWRQWGDSDGTNHDSSGGSQISSVSQIGGGNYGSFNNSGGTSESWTNGTPTSSNSGDTNVLYCNDVANAGWTFTAPADTTTRTLYVLWGGALGTTVKLNAHLSDGSATDYSDTKVLSGSGSTALYVETITYHAASASQTLTITLTNQDSVASSVDLMAAWLTTSASGSLSGSVSSPASSYNLTSVGTTDWDAWGVGGTYGTNDKKNVTSWISSLSTYGSGGNWGAYYGFPDMSWSDGTPTASYTNDTGFVWQNADATVDPNCGFTFTVPASTTSHTLYILTGGYQAYTQLTASLSDGSAPNYTNSQTYGTASPLLTLYTITYNAASSGKTLTITLVKTGNNGATNGSTDLAAAWLH